jgi:hypothetical protein
MGNPSGLSFPEFFYVCGGDRILWNGIVASFDGKEVLMVVYFNFKEDCIAHKTFLIQCHEATYLMPSLYNRRRGRDRGSYESFRCLQVGSDPCFFSQKIKANRFEVDSYYGLNALERTGRLSNDNGETWTMISLSFSAETMSLTLTLIPSD